jgi:hypothetical protein
VVGGGKESGMAVQGRGGRWVTGGPRLSAGKEDWQWERGPSARGPARRDPGSLTSGPVPV